MKALNSVQKKQRVPLKLNIFASKIVQAAIVLWSLNITAACVITPDGDYATVGASYDAGIDVGLAPQILTSSSSFVTVRIGPRFYASDAYLLAYDHCLDLGLYPYAESSWSHSASIVRDLRYNCRSGYIAPPLVYQINRNNRYRYNYFNDHYFRNHRPNYHYRPPTTGWWGKNHYNPSYPRTNSTTPQVYQGPGYTRDGRATTPSSPRSYNPGKDRYVPRSKYGSTYSSPPVSNPPKGTKPGWWGQGNSNSSPSKYEAPRNLPRSKYESSNSAPATKYESRGSSPRSYPSPSSSPRSNDASPKPSFWGKSKDTSSSNTNKSINTPSRPSYSKYSSSLNSPRSKGTDYKKGKDSTESSKGSKPSWMR